MDILRIATAGSVDDGKSTLIGRLLYDSKSIMIDHLEAILFPENAESLKLAERNARAFLQRMKKLQKEEV